MVDATTSTSTVRETRPQKPDSYQHVGVSAEDGCAYVVISEETTPDIQTQPLSPFVFDLILPQAHVKPCFQVATMSSPPDQTQVGNSPQEKTQCFPQSRQIPK